MSTQKYASNPPRKQRPAAAQPSFLMQPKTLACVLAVALNTGTVQSAYAGTYSFNNVTTPEVIAGVGGENNTLTVTNSTIGSAAAPVTGGGMWPALISLGGNNGSLPAPSSPFDFHNLTINMDNVKAYGSNTNATGLEGVYGKTDTANSAVKFDIKNSIFSVATTGLYSNAILAENFGVNGTVDVKVANTQLINTYTGTAPDAAQAIRAGGKGNTSVTIDAGSSVTSSGLQAGAVYASSDTGYATIDNSGTISATGNSAHGLQGTSTSGDVSITNRGGVTTNGSNSHGIYAMTGNGNVTVTNSGAIKTGSGLSHGIFNQISGNGSGTITNTGDVTVMGTGSALRIEATSGNGTINQDGGNLIVNGNADSGAVYVRTENAGNATVNMNGGTLTSHSTNNNAHGLEAQSRGTGDATVHLNAGTISTAGGIGIVAWHNSSTLTGNATVTTAAGTTITATGTGTNAGGIGASGGSAADGTSVLVDSKSIINGNTFGIKADSYFGGYVKVTQTGGSVTSNGVGINGSSAGSVDITNSGTVTTSGTYAHGVFAQSTGSGAATIDNTGNVTTNGTGTALRSQGVNGNATVNQKGGDLIANGTLENGVAYAYTNGTGAATVNMSGGALTNHSTSTMGHGLEAKAEGSGNAAVNLTAGNVTTTAGYGIASWRGATGTGGASTTTAEGTSISALGANAAGIYTYGATTASVDSKSTVVAGGVGVYGKADSGAVTVKQTGGSVTAGGIGVRAKTPGAIDMINTVTVKTTGEAAHGLSAEGGTGVVTVSNSGSVTTSGDKAAGISAKSTDGNIDIGNTNAISTSGITGYGITASATGAGTAKVNNSGSIQTDGERADGIHVTSSTGNIDIANSAQITANGLYAFGILGESLSGGNVNINGIGNINVTNTSAGSAFQYGVFAHTSTGKAAIDYSGAVTTQGYNSTGVRAIADDTGDASIIYTGSKVEVYGDDADAIIALSRNGNATVKAQGDLITHADSGTGNGTGQWAFGIAALTGGDGKVDVDFSNGNIDVDGYASAGIYALSNYADVGGSGDVTIKNAGNIITRGLDDNSAIWANTLSGAIDITNSGTLTTLGTDSPVIRALTQTGLVSIENSGDLNSTGNNAHGIYINAGNAVVNIINDGNIHISGSQSKGILSITGDNSTIDITNNGSILHDTAGPLQYGIEARGASNNSITIQNNGRVEGAEFGIVAWTDFVPHTGSSSTINIGNQGVVDALYAISADMSDSNTINIADGGRVNGKVFALNLRSQGTATPLYTVNNAGAITSDRDQILRTQLANPGATININNQSSGVMTGYMLADNANVTVNNAGQWNVRHFADTNSDQIRDTLAVAVSDFGSSGNNSVTNSGVIALLGDNGQATTLNSTGAYSTGYAANTMTIGGAVQGQILNVKSFSNSGTIDMGPANAAVGDVLLISGGNTPGVSGGGTYIANGGQVILDTVLNQGGANSQSDMLVVDGTQLGSAADKITVINVGGQGALSQGNGIELVRVLDKNRSAGDLFKLSGRVVAGIYEYDLFQGGVGADASDGNWYLRALTGSPTPAPRPETGVYLRNMAAASGMFMHTLHDRLGEPQYTDKYKEEENGKVSSLWVRVVGSHVDSSAGNGDIGLDTDTSLVHLGGDLARWSNDGQDRWQFGLMGAYGQSDVDASASKHLYTNSGYKRTANGSVDGYGAGAYLTWYGNKDKPTGPYVDLWGMYGWYQNKVQGNGFKEEKYDSNGWTLSAETGYAFVAHDGEKRQWMIEPQAQIAYNSYSADDHYEQQTNTRVHNDDADGVTGRLGARLYSRSKLGDNGMQPFVEANWWYNSAKNSLMFNGDTLSEDTPDSTFELKAGLQGEIAKNWQLWGHIGGRWGENNYRSYEGMVGVKYQF